MLIAECRFAPGNWLELYRKFGDYGAYMWQYTENRDEATRFTDINDYDKRTKKHRYFMQTNKHQLGI